MNNTNRTRASAPWHLTGLNPERRFLLHHVGFDKTIVRAVGTHVIDDRGTTYLDALAQYGAVPFGHNPSFLWDCLEQARVNCEPCFVQPLLNPAAEALSQLLLALCPHLSRVTFVNSGAEATEAAIKLARACTGRRRIVTLERGFHGKTNAALCATANLRYRQPFLVDEAQFTVAPFADLTALESLLSTREVAAFIVEPVQGEGGMRVQPAGYLQEAQALCRRYGTLFVIDEVQTGLGRTGELFGYMQHGPLEPDVILLAKALGGGLLPIGAMLCTQDAWTEAFGMLHSSTFANNHLSALIGHAVLTKLLENDGALIRDVQKRGAQMSAGLNALAKKYPDVIAGVYGQGLMQGIELQPWSGETSYFNSHASHSGYAVPIVSGYLLNTHKVLTAPTFNTSNVLRIQPSLVVSEAEVNSILRALDATAALINEEEFADLFSSMVPASITAAAPRGSVRRIPRSQRVPLLNDGPKKKRRFAFLIHATDDDARFGILPPAIKDQGEPARTAWLQWMTSWSEKMHEPAPVLRMASVDSATGDSVEGWLIATQLTPEEMIRMGSEARAYLLDQYVAAAQKLDVDIIGLGAFTSVISQGGTMLTECGTHITTGNSLTALASAETLLRYAALRSENTDEECFAVVGAAGSVGRLVAFHLAHHGARRLRLIGNAANRRALTALKAVGAEIMLHALHYGTADDSHGLATALRMLPKDQVNAFKRRYPNDVQIDETEYAQLYDEFGNAFAKVGVRDCPVSITTDVVAGVRDARFVVTATSAGRSFITPDVFMQGAVICDVARPLDVFNKMEGVRDDLLVFEGGLLRMPGAIRFGDQNVLGYPDGVNLACLSETIVLALEGATHHYSIGNRISYRDARDIYAAALKHGFRLYFDPELEARSHDARDSLWVKDRREFEVDVGA